MPQAISIDNFIDAHRRDQAIKLCGKLAIVQAILAAERQSHLSQKEPKRSGELRYMGLKETWYARFMELLCQGCEVEGIEEPFEAVSFITFNYDRCIEHFLFHSLQNYYGVSAEKAAEMMEGLSIYHPYGQVGDLPWQVGFGEGTDFGSDREGPNLLSLADRIKTFTERFEDDAARNEIQSLVLEADTIVFLGFSFDLENVRLMAPSERGKVDRIFATATNISAIDCSVIETRVTKHLAISGQFDIRNDLTCETLFREYWRSL